MTILWPILILGILGAAFGVLLGFAAKAFRVEKDERIEQITELLAGANCGGCGYPGCGGFAEGLCAGKANLSDCPSTKAEAKEKIAEILGVSAGESVPMVAMVMCSGSCSSAMLQCEYEGITDCIAASRYGGGDKACNYGCIGYGSCVDVCQFDAIHVIDNVAVVDKDKCTACGACVDICPQHTISLVEAKQRTFVKCKSKDKGGALKNICSAGCIGCRICEKSCPKQAITISDNLAQINYELCVNCGICASKCPRKIIDFTRPDGTKPYVKEVQAEENTNQTVTAS